jgi:hypothetical protein
MVGVKLLMGDKSDKTARAKNPTCGDAIQIKDKFVRAVKRRAKMGKIQAVKVPLIACSILSILGITASSSVGAKGTGTPGFPRRTGGAFK